jgi:hypothetical protein
MKLTNESHKLMSFFIKQNCIQSINQIQSKKTDNILKIIYKDIKNGVSYIDNLKTKKGPSFYNLKIENIIDKKKLPKPSTFSPDSFPEQVRNHIDNFSVSSLTYKFNLFSRHINIIFVTEDDNIENTIETYNTYIDYMLVWLYIVNIYSSKSCVKQLKIFVYHTQLLKELPNSNTKVLNENNVNTAFTRTCPINSEIVVFRKEEWFKVFMHETFHNFGLDFSDMSLSSCNEKILSIFPVKSNVNLFEAYTEFWARIMNVSFCSFVSMTNKDDVEEFLTNVEMFINLERIFSFFQVVKVLNFMGLSYEDLYKKNKLAEHLRKTMYKEDTNVLSYYVITLIMINSYQDYLLWCNTNNESLLQFKKSSKNIDNLCKFIESKYKIKSLLDGINCVKNILLKLNKLLKNNRSANLSYLLKNMRMTLCELG